MRSETEGGDIWLTNQQQNEGTSSWFKKLVIAFRHALPEASPIDEHILKMSGSTKQQHILPVNKKRIVS